MFFYKYQKAGNLEFNMLRRGEIYFASDEELNDANECRSRFILNGSEELWWRLAEFVLERVCFGVDYYRGKTTEEIQDVLQLSKALGRQLKKRVRSRDFRIEELGELFIEMLGPSLEEKLPQLNSRLFTQLVKNFIDEHLPRLLREERYMASFSKNATNPTMWGHYAGAETGFVIVYGTDDKTIHVRSPIHILNGSRPSNEFSSIVEIGIYRDERLKLHEVTYARRPPKVNAFHRLIHRFSYSEEEDHYDVPLQLGGDAPDKQESILGLVKYSDWRYEQEVRAFFPSKDALSADIRALSVSFDNIRGLIFGPRMSSSNKIRAVLCCHLMRESLATTASQTEKAVSQFVFLEARQVVDRFGFEIRPIGVLEGSYFGDHLPLKKFSDLDKSMAEKVREMAKCIEARGK